MAADLAGAPARGLRGAAVRRRPSLQLRRFRGTRPTARLQRSTTSTRRCRARSSGTSSASSASFAVAGRAAGFEREERRSILIAGGRALSRGDARRSPACGNLDVWYARLDAESCQTRIGRRRATKAREAVRTQPRPRRSAKDSMKAFDKLTELVDGEPRILSDPPLIVPIDDLAGRRGPRPSSSWIRVVISLLPAQPAGRSSAPVRTIPLRRTAARKVVGVGSVGTRAWVVLLLGSDGDDPLFLQIKEAEASVLEPFLGEQQVRQPRPARRRGQRLMQAASDIMLGWIRVDRARRHDALLLRASISWDGKGSADVNSMNPRALTFYAHVCGWTLARAHARSGDAIAIASYLGRGDAFDRALASFAEIYADQNSQTAVAHPRSRGVRPTDHVRRR